MIDQTTIEKWSPLHHRAVLGEAMSAEERAFYEAVLRQMEDDEVLMFDADAARLQEQELARLEAKRIELKHQWVSLQKELNQVVTRRKRTKKQPIGAAS